MTPENVSARRVSVFDLTTSEGRQEYEDLVGDPGVAVQNSQDFGFGGTGQVVRVVDYKEKPVPNGEFTYLPPVC